MKKTRKMLEIEERIGEPIEQYLRREYVDKKRSIKEIGEKLGVTDIRNWLKKYNINIRNRSEAKLPKGFVKPPREDMVRMYVHERLSVDKVGERLGVSSTTVLNLLREYMIPIRDLSESRLPEGFVKPTKEELEQMYVREGMGTTQIGKKLGISHSTIYNWLREYNIQIREQDKLPEGVTKPSKDELKKMYIDQKMSTKEIGEKLGVNNTTVFKWLKEYSIERRSISEAVSIARLPKGFVKPPREDMVRMYVHERLSPAEIGEKLGVTDATIRNWLNEYNIPTRDYSEAHLPKGVTKPSEEELEKMYVHQRMNTTEIAKIFGINKTTIIRWLNEYNIPIRDRSEAKLPKGFVKPSKEELRIMYVDKGMNSYEIGEKVGVGQATVLRWLKKHNIPIRSNKLIPDSQFINFLKNNESALNLAGTALLINSERNDMESLILQVFPGTFKNRDELNSLLDKNEKEIYSLVKEGLTNLGTYIGNYTLDDRAIIPILIGEALAKIPFDKLTSSLEEKVVRILRNEYSPQFNDDPQETVSRLEKTIEQYNGKVREIYQRLYNHYQEVIQLQQELL